MPGLSMQRYNTKSSRELRAQAPPKAGFLWRRRTRPRPPGAYQHFVFCDYVTSNEGRDVLGDGERRTGQKVRWPKQQGLLRHVDEDSLQKDTQLLTSKLLTSPKLATNAQNKGAHGREVCVNGLSLNGLLLYAKNKRRSGAVVGSTSGNESSSEDGNESEGNSSVSRSGEGNEIKTDRRGRGLEIDVAGIRGGQMCADVSVDVPGIRGGQHTATHYNTLQHTATHCNTPQHTATHCNTLQHTATHCNTLHHLVFKETLQRYPSSNR